MNTNIFTRTFLGACTRQITEDFDNSVQVTDMPPEQEDMQSGDADAQQSMMSSDSYDALRQELDQLPSDGQMSNQAIIDLGRKYAEYLDNVKSTIEELQEKQLSNQFEDCLKVKFLPLTKALSTMVDELKAGVADKVYDKNSRVAKDKEANV